MLFLSELKSLNAVTDSYKSSENNVFFLANHTKMVGPVKFVSFREKGIESDFFFLSGIHGTAPCDLIKIFDENELEVFVNILRKGDFYLSCFTADIVICSHPQCPSE